MIYIHTHTQKLFTFHLHIIISNSSPEKLLYASALLLTRYCCLGISIHKLSIIFYIGLINNSVILLTLHCIRSEEMEQSAQRKILIDHPWINKNLFESIFKEESIKFNEICSFTVDLASKGAENFSSELMTATVYYEPEIDDEGSNETGNTKSSSGIVLEKNFIIKARSQLIRSRDVCKKEIWMYAYVIPMLENAFAHVGRILNLAP